MSAENNNTIPLTPETDVIMVNQQEESNYEPSIAELELLAYQAYEISPEDQFTFRAGEEECGAEYALESPSEFKSLQCDEDDYGMETGEEDNTRADLQVDTATLWSRIRNNRPKIKALDEIPGSAFHPGAGNVHLDDWKKSKHFNMDNAPLNEYVKGRDIEFSFRRIDSELWHAPSYVPYVVKNPGFYYSGDYVKNLDKWREVLSCGEDEESINALLDALQVTGIYKWYQNVTPDVMPSQLAQMFQDLEFRSKYAWGKSYLFAAGTGPTMGRYFFYEDDFGNPHCQCSLNWIKALRGSDDQLTVACLCWRRIGKRMLDPITTTCCYTQQFMHDDDYHRLQPTRAVDNMIIMDQIGRENREYAECIYLVLRMYFPAVSMMSLAWNSKRFTNTHLQGLYFYPKVTWAGVFTEFPEYEELDCLGKQSRIMRTMVMELLMNEWYNRPTMKSLVPWEYFTVKEMVPDFAWHDSVEMLLEGALQYILSGKTHSWKCLVENYFECPSDVLFVAKKFPELLRCVSRSVEDWFEYNQVFNCDRCNSACFQRSFVMMPIDSIEHDVSICDLIREAETWGIGSRMYCTDTGDASDHIGYGHIPAADNCCTRHAVLQKFTVVQYESGAYERVCWNCARSHDQFLWLGRTQADCFDFVRLNSDHNRTHTGAWWLDVNKALKLLAPPSTKRSVKD